MIRMESAIDGYQGRRGELRTAIACSPPRSTTPATATPSTAPPPATTRSTRGSRSRTAPTSGTRRCASTSRRCSEHDVGSVMPSFSSVDWTEDGVGNPIKMHANRELITGVLKGSMGFDGFVISDWEGIHQIPGDWADPGPHRRERRDRHDDGAEHVPELHHHAARRGERGPGADEPDRRRGPPDPHQEVRARAVRAPVHRPPQHRRDRLAARTARWPARRPRSRRCCSRTSTGRCRCARARACTWRAPTPTTSATRPAAGRSPGRAARPT